VSTLPLAILGGYYFCLRTVLEGLHNRPADLTPAEPLPPSLLERLYRTVGLGELRDAISNHRTTETLKEES
jgi:hypothetical protein